MNSFTIPKDKQEKEYGEKTIHLDDSTLSSTSASLLRSFLGPFLKSLTRVSRNHQIHPDGTSKEKSTEKIRNQMLTSVLRWKRVLKDTDSISALDFFALVNRKRTGGDMRKSRDKGGRIS